MEVKDILNITSKFSFIRKNDTLMEFFFKKTGVEITEKDATMILEYIEDNGYSLVVNDKENLLLIDIENPKIEDWTKELAICDLLDMINKWIEELILTLERFSRYEVLRKQMARIERLIELTQK